MSIKPGHIARAVLVLAAVMFVWTVWTALAATGPRVRITHPEDGARFQPGSSIQLDSETAGFKTPVARVVYFANGRRIGAVTTPPFQMFWTNVGSGIHNLTAEATDETGLEAVSEPIRIRVQESMGLLTFGLDRVPILQRQFLENPTWQYIALLIYIILAFYVSKFLDFFIRFRLKKRAEKTATRFDDMLIECIRGPIKVVAFVILFHIGLRFFQWTIWIEDLLSKGLKLIVAFSLTYMALRMVDLLTSYWRDRAVKEEDKTFDQQLFPIIRKSLKVFVVIVAVLVTSQNVGVNVTGLIASLSIGGLALGLAAQDTLGNLFGAIAIFGDKPFRVGDRIQLEGIDGVVESIGLRSTRVRNLDGHLITVPNKTMGNATITNVTQRPNIRTLMNISITYNTPVEKVKRAVAILNEVFKNHPMTHDAWIAFNKFENSSLNIFIIHWWKSTVFKDYMEGMQEMNLAIKQKFDEEGIEFAFPTQTLYVKQDSDFRVTSEDIEQAVKKAG